MIFNKLKRILPKFTPRFMKPKPTNQEELTNTEPDELYEQVVTQSNQIEWVECEDVYKPIEKPIKEFIEEKEIRLPYTPVYILQSALTTLKTHLEANTTVEQGGFFSVKLTTIPSMEYM